VREAKKKWEAENPESVRALKKRAYEREREQGKRRYEDRRAAQPEVFAAYAARAREKARELGRYALYRHGLSLEQRKEIFDRQGGTCALCPRSLVDYAHVHVDHDHRTDKIRGLLCGGCNAKLGWYENRIEVIAQYLAGPHMTPARPRPPSQRAKKS
jgi:hypothetical protein